MKERKFYSLFFVMNKEVSELISQEMNDPIVEWRVCRWTGKEFPIFQGDVDMLEKLSPVIRGKKYLFPLPVLSPAARQMERMMFRNDRHLYPAVCDLSGEKTISRINQELGYTVYTNEHWAGDDRDYSDYAIDIDWGKTFFEHIEILSRSSPYQNLIGSLSNTKNNAIYTNYTAEISDSYLTFESDGVDKACYCVSCRNSTHIVDCFVCSDMELCFECMHCKKLHHCAYCFQSSACSHSYWLHFCQGCSHCI